MALRQPGQPGCAEPVAPPQRRVARPDLRRSRRRLSTMKSIPLDARRDAVRGQGNHFWSPRRAQSALHRRRHRHVVRWHGAADQRIHRRRSAPVWARIRRASCAARTTTRHTGGYLRQFGRLPDFLGGPVFAGGVARSWRCVRRLGPARSGASIPAFGVDHGHAARSGAARRVGGFDGRWRTYIGVGRVFR